MESTSINNQIYIKQPSQLSNDPLQEFMDLCGFYSLVTLVT